MMRLTRRKRRRTPPGFAWDRLRGFPLVAIPVPSSALDSDKETGVPDMQRPRKRNSGYLPYLPGRYEVTCGWYTRQPLLHAFDDSRGGRGIVPVGPFCAGEIGRAELGSKGKENAAGLEARRCGPGTNRLRSTFHGRSIPQITLFCLGAAAL